MIIYSWNMLYDNKRLDEAFAFISSLDFDIFCLQEVPQKFLDKLTTLPYEMVFTKEIVLRSAREETTIYSVTLSKFPIQASQEIPLRDPSTALRTRITRRLLHIHRKEKSFVTASRNALIVDFVKEGEMFRVCNLHLPLTSPKERLDELRHISTFQDEATMIICGDFNILESFHISVFNWLLGGTFFDFVLYKKERISMESHFASIGLRNPLYRTITHPVSLSQLDHILIPHNQTIKSAYVIKNSFGSDHRPIRVEVG